MTDAADGPTALVEAVDRRDLPRFEAAWRDLAARAGEPNAFAEADFLIPALQRLANARVRTLLVWRDANRDALIGLAAIAPPRLPFGLASLWRSEQAALPAILLDRDAATEALAAIVDALRAGAPRLVGLRLPFSTVDGPVAAAAAALAARRALTLEDRPSAPARGARRRRESELRGAARQAAAQGMGAPAAAPGGARPRWNRASAPTRRRSRRSSRWRTAAGRARAGSALDAHAERAAFARETLARFAARGALEVHSLTLRDEPIAAAAVLRAGNRAFYWKTAYDERFAAYSPGVQATLDLSRRLERDPGLSLVDSCAVADHPMIDRAWRDRLELVDLALSLAPGGGAAFALATAAAHGIERLKRRARRPRRRGDAARRGA